MGFLFFSITLPPQVKFGWNLEWTTFSLHHLWWVYFQGQKGLIWVTITNSNKKVEQNQAYPVGALCMDIYWAEFQNPTMSPFWENCNQIYTMILSYNATNNYQKLTFGQFPPIRWRQSSKLYARNFEFMRKSFICNQEIKIWPIPSATMSSGRWVTQAQNLDVYQIKSFFS